MPLVTRQNATYTQVLAPAVIGFTARSTLATIDLRNKQGANVVVSLGRFATTAPSNAANVAVRRTINGTRYLPDQSRDVQSSLAAAIQTTLSANALTGTRSIVVASAASLAVGDVLCLRSPDTAASRVEFVSIAWISGTTIELETALKLDHNSGDVATTQGIVSERYLDGGDIYEMVLANGTGQSFVVAIDAVIDNGVQF